MSTHFLLGVFLLLCCSVSGMNSYYVLTGWRPVSYSHLHHACMPLEYIVCALIGRCLATQSCSMSYTCRGITGRYILISFDSFYTIFMQLLVSGYTTIIYSNMWCSDFAVHKTVTVLMLLLRLTLLLDCEYLDR